jgi:hypothetical protein
MIVASIDIVITDLYRHRPVWTRSALQRKSGSKTLLDRVLTTHATAPVSLNAAGISKAAVSSTSRAHIRTDKTP